jgi:hypothetical protein
MIISERIKFWKKLAQTTAVPTVNTQAPTISLSQIPNYRVNLFSKKPEFAQDIEKVINLFNKYLFILTDGKLDFSNTWKAPSISGSQFTNSTKNIYSLSKWIYDVVSSNENPYSIDGMKKIISDLKDRVSNIDVPEPKASTFKSEVINICQVISNKLGSG